MYSKFLLLSFLFFTLLYRIHTNVDNCDKNYWGAFYCGSNCTGTPQCGANKKCGNVDNMCYCECGLIITNPQCRTTDLGYKWNNGIKLANGSYALNGTKGDGNEYKC